MAMTLVEWAKTVDDPAKSAVIETLYLEEPLFQLLPVEFLDGLSLVYPTEKELPSVGFRKLNEAFSESTGVVQRNVETLKAFGGDSDVDIALARNKPDVRRRYDKMRIKATGINFVKWFLYGNSGARTSAAYDDVDAFDGLATRITGASQIVNAGGSSQTDGTSVFALKFGDTYVQGLMQSPGMNARDLGELQTKPVYRTRVDCEAGMAIYHGRACGWLRNISAAGSTPCVCDDVDELIDTTAGLPDVLIMSKRSRRELKQNAWTKGVTFGREVSDVGTPLETYGNIPIICSDAVINTEVI
jgi:hypothetical protein